MQKIKKTLFAIGLLVVALIFRFSDFRSDEYLDARRVGFFKQAYLECFDNDPPKKIDSVGDLDCLNFYPEQFKKDVIDASHAGKIKLYSTTADENFFIFWSLPGRSISISILGESKITRN